MKIIYDTVISSYLNYISNQRNEIKHANIRHTNEKLPVENFRKDVRLMKNNIGCEILETYVFALVMNKENKRLKTTVDFLCIAKTA